MEGIKAVWHPLVEVIATAGFGVTEFVAELDALCWNCCCAVHPKIDSYCFGNADTEPYVVGQF